jgi:hypothetical protein
MGDDAEQDGPAGREHYRVDAGQFFVEDEDRENDCGQSARAEPADEKRIRGARSCDNQAQKVTVRRSDRLLVGRTGDDGSTKLFYGKTVVLFGIEGKKYVTIPAPNTLQGMLETVMGKLGVDFPLADFLTNTPDRSFLWGLPPAERLTL